MTEPDDPNPDQKISQALVRLLPKLRRFCLALTASPADADDLCQSTYERAITRLDYWIPGTRLDSWLYRIAQNLHKNAVRDDGNRLRLLEEQSSVLFGPTENQASQDSDIEANELRQHVLSLAHEQREVLILICVEGYSYKECADLLELPATTVTNRLFQARMHLREVIEAETQDDVAPKRSASV